MGNLSNIGRIFFGIAIAVMGFLTIYDHDFPYMLIPPNHTWIPGLAMVANISGVLLLLAGAAIFFKIKLRTIALLLGTVLLLIFCLYFIPYQLMVSPNYKQFGDWENAAKELALAGGALVIACCFNQNNESALTAFLSKLIPLGRILFAITIISFGVDHYLFAQQAADYVPSWVPWHLLWMYFTGTALLASGIAILFKIKTRLAATLLGSMILCWVILLHIPRIIVSPAAYIVSEVTSAVIALAYGGIGFLIAGCGKKL